MYRKYALLLLICNGLLLLSIWCVKGSGINRNLSEFYSGMKLTNNSQEVDNQYEMKTIRVAFMQEQEGIQPKLNVDTIQKEHQYDINSNDYEILLKIVQAEAGGEDMVGKILVANVILNRVNDDQFPDTIEDVVFQQENGVTQFSPISNGTYGESAVTTETIEAVERALCGEDYSQGALYFASRKYANSSSMKWFDESLSKVMSYGGHEFFR